MCDERFFDCFTQWFAYVKKNSMYKYCKRIRFVYYPLLKSTYLETFKQIPKITFDKDVLFL